MATSIVVAHGVSEVDVPDVLQEVWTTLLSHPPKDRATAASAVTTAARRQALLWMRRTGRERAAGLLPEAPLVDPSDFDHLGLEITEHDLIEAIRRMPRHCQVLLFALLGGLPDQNYADLSRSMDIPVGSIGPTRARCLRRLRNDLASRYGSPKSRH
jgi:DNA-directed RNA polymerase specialized sigma24 family protein